MRAKAGRVIGITAASLIWLAGCETTSSFNPFKAFNSDPVTTGSVDTTGSVEQGPNTGPVTTPELLGTDPNDDVSVAKKYFRQGSYGLAEGRFRKAVELHPKDVEAWIGLAASYDRLRRFDLADRAYAQAIRLTGATPEILNNQGFSYLLRGDYARARTTLLAARAKDPANPYIQNNLLMLEESARKKQAVN